MLEMRRHMDRKYQMLSVLDIARICGVSRSSVSYWIAKKDLRAHRLGKKDMVRVDDLVIFLQSDGRPVPQVLQENVGGAYTMPIRPFQNCWEYWKENAHGSKCPQCIASKNHINECFTAKQRAGNRCGIKCNECRYFHEYYGARMTFIHQLEIPAAVTKDLYLWSANEAWADLCGTGVEQLIGAGIEELVHPESLKIVVNYNKKLQQGDAPIFFRNRVIFERSNGENVLTYLTISPLKKPSATWLAIAEGVSRTTA